MVLSSPGPVDALQWRTLVLPGAQRPGVNTFFSCLGSLNFCVLQLGGDAVMGTHKVSLVAALYVQGGLGFVINRRVSLWKV